MSNPNIPNEVRASGNTILSQRISTQNMVDISGHPVVDELRALGSGDADLSRPVRNAARSVTEGWTLNPGETRLQAYIRSRLPTEAREAEVIKFRNPDGSFSYIVRNNSAYIGRPTIAGTVRGGRFRPSATPSGSVQQTPSSGTPQGTPPISTGGGSQQYSSLEQAARLGESVNVPRRANSAAVAIASPRMPFSAPNVPAPGVVELDPTPTGAGYALIAADVLHDLAEATHVTGEYQTWEETLTTNPGPYAAGATILRLTHELVETERSIPKRIEERASEAR
jgi:hypothetical protein